MDAEAQSTSERALDNAPSTAAAAAASTPATTPSGPADPDDSRIILRDRPARFARRSPNSNDREETLKRRALLQEHVAGQRAAAEARAQELMARLQASLAEDANAGVVDPPRTASSPQEQREQKLDQMEHGLIASEEHLPSFLGADWSPPNASEELECLRNLRARFPELPRNVVEHALHAHRGHAGHAAAALQVPSLRWAISDAAEEDEIRRSARATAEEARAREAAMAPKVLRSRAAADAAEERRIARRVAEQALKRTDQPFVTLPPPTSFVKRSLVEGDAAEEARIKLHAAADSPARPPRTPLPRTPPPRIGALEAVQYVAVEHLAHVRRMQRHRAFVAYLQSDLDPTELSAKAVALLSAFIWSVVAQYIGGSAGYWHLADEWLTLNIFIMVAAAQWPPDAPPPPDRPPEPYWAATARDGWLRRAREASLSLSAFREAQEHHSPSARASRGRRQQQQQEQQRWGRQLEIKSAEEQQEEGQPLLRIAAPASDDPGAMSAGRSHGTKGMLSRVIHAVGGAHAATLTVLGHSIVPTVQAASVKMMSAVWSAKDALVEVISAAKERVVEAITECISSNACLAFAMSHAAPLIQIVMAAKACESFYTIFTDPPKFLSAALILVLVSGGTHRAVWGGRPRLLCRLPRPTVTEHTAAAVLILPSPLHLLRIFTALPVPPLPVISSANRYGRLGSRCRERPSQGATSHML